MRSIHKRLYPLALIPALAISALLAGMVLTSCNDSPTTIGADYIPRDIEFRSYTLKPGDFTIESGLSDAANSSGEGGIGVAVGRAPDGTVAHGMLGFTTQSPTISGSSARPVTSASLRLHAVRYRYGDTTTRQLSFDVVVLDQTFGSNTKWSEVLASQIDNAPSLGTFNGDFPDSGTVSITLDPTATQKFLREYFTLDNASQITVKKTLALRATTGNRIVATFLGVLGVADSNQPELRVVAGDTTVNLRAGVTNWIAKSDVDSGVGKIIAMAGLPIRTLIKLNIDSIPADAAIHQAELRLFYDSSKSRHGTMGQTSYLVGYLATDTSFTSGSRLKSSIAGVFPVNRVARDTSSFTNIFRFTTLSPTISGWLRNRRGVGTLKNLGIILAYNRGATGVNLETSTVDRTVFHGVDAADPSLRPQLTIIYSVQVDAK